MASSASTGQHGAVASLSFQPPPNELSYYDGLFNLADLHKAGFLAGSEAVQFLSRSQIPTPTLKNIWNMADQNPKTNSLDKQKFYVVVRLIQLFQNGQRPQGANLTVANEGSLKPAHFEGITGVSVMPTGPPNLQLSPQSQSSQPPQLPNPQPMTTPQYNNNQGHSFPNPSTALTTQDPYSMAPNEQSRYEALFPNYEKLKDGFVYGAEAVALFSRSGLSKEQLRDIWNLSDNPVDNRLDKIEFAIAMHLIVCVSKKNLEVPKILPPSLQSLKKPPMPEQSQQFNSNSINQVGTTGMNIPPPAHNQQNELDPPNVGMNMGQQQPPVADQGLGFGQQSINQPPHNKMLKKEPSQRMSISDAFEDMPGMLPEPTPIPALVPTQAPLASSDPPSLNKTEPLTMNEPLSVPDVIDSSGDIPPLSQPTTQSTQPPQQQSLTMNPKASMMSIPPPIEDIPVSLPNPTVNDTSQIGNQASSSADHTSTSYHNTEDRTELEKVKKVLQQLQAENISLKAKLNTFSGEEVNVRNEITDIVSEIEELSKELATLRNEVAEAKASLVEATSELTTEKKKKEDIKEAIKDTKETLDVLNLAVESVEKVKEEVEQREEAVAPAPPTYDFFGGFDEPVQSQPPNPTPIEGPYDNTFSNDTMTPNEVEAAPQPDSTLNSDFEQPVPPEPQNHLTNFINPATDIYNDQNNLAFSGGIPAPDSNGLYMHATQPPVPAALGVMGGQSSVNMTNNVINHNSFGHVNTTKHALSPPSQDEALRMQKEALEAAEIAVQAEQKQQEAFMEAERLQNEAEVAEAELREMENAMSSKKKGFGRSGKKAQKKEYELASQRVSEKKKSAEAAKSKISELQVFAMKAKRAADELRQQSEQAEFDIAAAASIKDTSGPNGNAPNGQGNVSHTQNGGVHSLGGDASMSAGVQNAPANNAPQGFDNPFNNYSFPTTARPF